MRNDRFPLTTNFKDHKNKYTNYKLLCKARTLCTTSCVRTMAHYRYRSIRRRNSLLTRGRSGRKLHLPFVLEVKKISPNHSGRFFKYHCDMKLAYPLINLSNTLPTPYESTAAIAPSDNVSSTHLILLLHVTILLRRPMMIKAQAVRIDAIVNSRSFGMDAT